MSRYIESEWLQGRVHDVTLANGALHGCIDKLDIHEAPSIDIVHCRECIYRNNRKKCPMRVFTGDNGFCSCGKGTDDEADNI